MLVCFACSYRPLQLSRLKTDEHWRGCPACWSIDPAAISLHPCYRCLEYVHMTCDSRMIVMELECFEFVDARVKQS